ncbi:hypothetical protein C2S51_001677 [Perilla frutescens var. frutescens]|nr:hypothetical protein C2S51_001677 [Perilla frutescens var. frutescens]
MARWPRSSFSISNLRSSLSAVIELMKEASCTIRLSSNSPRNVAFKVMTTSPEKYSVQPNIGIISPGSTCDVEVKMHAQKEAPPNMQCKDKFLIKSVVASPGDTVEKSQKMFNDRSHAVGDYKLRVVYVLPSRQQSSKFYRLGQGSSLNGSILQERSLSGTQFQGRNGKLVDNLFVKGIIILSISLIVLYLIVKILPVIWSWIFVATILVTKMAKRLVSDSVEDWVGKTLFYVIIHLFSVLFQRKNRSDQESRVAVVG